MEDENKWFKDDKKGIPLFEKFAMLFFGYLIAKYTVKAIKKLPKAKKDKNSWKTWMRFWICFILGVVFMVGTGILDSGIEGLIEVVLSMIILPLVFKHFFVEK